MLTSQIIMHNIEENMGRIRRYGVEKIGLFGSCLGDEQRTESDVDILVVFVAGKKTFDNYMELKFFLADLFKRKVDLVIAGAIKPDLRPYILGSVKYAAEV